MKTYELSTCFCTNEIALCSQFYQHCFAAKVIFDCGWSVNLRIGGEGPSIQFMQPQNEAPVFSGGGITLNVKVDAVDAEYERLSGAGLEIVMPLEDHPWGDRGFSVTDPIGNAVYICSDREPSNEFKQFYKA